MRDCRGSKRRLSNHDQAEIAKFKRYLKALENLDEKTWANKLLAYDEIYGQVIYEEPKK